MYTYIKTIAYRTAFGSRASETLQKLTVPAPVLYIYYIVYTHRRADDERSRQPQFEIRRWPIREDNFIGDIYSGVLIGHSLPMLASSWKQEAREREQQQTRGYKLQYSSRMLWLLG